MYVSGEGVKKRREIGLSAFFHPPSSSIAFSFDLLLNGTQTENTPKKLPDTQAITTCDVAREGSKAFHCYQRLGCTH